MRPGIQRHQALAQYRRRAPVYDLELLAFEPWRHACVQRLALRPGDAVLDLGCGTGLSFDLLQRRIGPAGRIVGIEQSAEMLARARQRVQAEGWRNVELIHAPVEEAAWAGRADAALFVFTHDILQQPGALRRVIGMLRQGARVASVGLTWGPPWALPVNAFVWAAASHSLLQIDALDRPWQRLADAGVELDVVCGPLGGIYLAHGRVA